MSNCPMDHSRKKPWMFTMFKLEDVEKLKEYAEYMVWQKELSPTTQNEHLQGFVIFHERKRLSQLKKLSDCHWEPMKSTIQHCIAYCTKTESRIEGPWHHGLEPSRPQKLEDVVAHIKENPGTSARDIYEKFPTLFIRNRNGILGALSFAQPPVRPDIRCLAVIGKPGIGKSHWAQTRYPDAYWKSPSNEYFDGYSGQKTIILDEFLGRIPFTVLTNLCDKYPCLLNLKGGSAPCFATTVVILSNLGTRQWYSNLFTENPVLAEAMERRLEIKVINERSDLLLIN